MDLAKTKKEPLTIPEIFEKPLADIRIFVTTGKPLSELPPKIPK
jgi:hypothetical protein